jgi:TolA-binding protein
LNQLALSTDLTVITAEINSFKQVAGQAVFEIGKRLKHVKKFDLAHGDFGKWVKTEIGLTPSQASHFISAFDQFGDLPTSASLQASKIFEMLSLPDSVDRAEFIAEPHIIPSSGESKQVEDMTVKELREVKKALQESELANLQHTQQQEALLAQIEQLRLVKDSPETLQRIAELEERVGREHQLAQDNIKLQRDMNKMERDFAEKITRNDKETQAYADLRKSLRSIINIVNMEQSNAIQQYRLVSGHKEANEAVQDFIKRFDPLVQELFKTWRGVTTLSEEVIVNVERTNTSG